MTGTGAGGKQTNQKAEGSRTDVCVAMCDDHQEVLASKTLGWLVDSGHHDMTVYSAGLASLGIASDAELALAQEAELQDVGVPLIHARKLLATVSPIQARPVTMQPLQHEVSLLQGAQPTLKAIGE